MQNGPGINVNWVPGITLDEMEKNCILAAFRFYRGNKTQTAGALGISIRTLEIKMERYRADAQAEQDRTNARKDADRATLEHFRGATLTRQFSTGSSSQWAVDGAGDEETSKEGGTTAQETGRQGMETTSGVSAQPTTEARTEPTVPMSKRGKVQKVLPAKAAASANRRHR